MKSICIYIISIISIAFLSCDTANNKMLEISAGDILGNPEYTAIAYGGYRHKTRDSVPSVNDLKEDMRILSALGIKIIRTYHTQQFSQVKRLLQAIDELSKDEGIEMYVMLGAWIQCENAWTANPIHTAEDTENNEAEIKAAIEFAKQYPHIVKVIAVGNESMVHWAWGYFVSPSIILKYVEQLQELKQAGEINNTIWITSSDNFASWGGGSPDYHTADLKELIESVDYISLHTYPFHDTHYNPEFWIEKDISILDKRERMQAAMLRATDYAISQYHSTQEYITSLGIKKEIHIGETGWSTMDNNLYGKNGSNAADEYKQKLYYDHMRNWSGKNRVSCFFFEAFDEPWKDGKNALGSENHFGLITINSKLKYALWETYDQGIFDQLKRNNLPLEKTYSGDSNTILMEALMPPIVEDISIN